MNVRRLMTVGAALLLAACSAGRGPVVAEAGGERIYERELYQEEAVARASGTLWDAPDSPGVRRFYDRTVEELVHRKLLRQEAERRGLRVPDDYIEAEVQRLRAQVGRPDGFRRLPGQLPDDGGGTPGPDPGTQVGRPAPPGGG